MSEKLSKTAEELKKEYFRQWKANNRVKINQYQRQWRSKNKDKVKEYERKYWEKKAQELDEN